jgi:hypothetical protein
MKKRFWKQYVRHLLLATTLLTASLWIVSCKDDYFYDEEEPGWLGASVYDYLKDNGNFSYYVRLIDDVGYTEVLAKTGSKTVFVADDAAFERFFQNNPWGVTGYNQLSLSQKKLILNFGMIDNAYLIETLANYYDGSLVTGAAVRRATAISVLDSISYENGPKLPETSYWQKYNGKGIYLLKDDSSWPMVHFLQKPLTKAGISDTDFELITGVSRSGKDAHIFNIKIVERDITCKNGYVHVLENVLVPPTNMAEHLREYPKTQIFSGLMERFSAPFYDSEQTINYKKLNPGFNDSLFTKDYFAVLGGAIYDPNLKVLSADMLLPYNPGWNSYRYQRSGVASTLQSDMAAIFAPTDEAMEAYFNEGAGIILKERFGSWENVPNDIVMLLLKRHMRESFIESVPSRFPKLNDSENSRIPIAVEDVESCYVGVNGVVYHTKEVYPPDDYVSVYGPVLFSEQAQVFKWAVLQNDFRLYLNSLVSRYSFFVPTDEFFTNYLEPVSYGKDKPGMLKFWMNKVTGNVNATVYAYNPVTNVVGDSVAVITNTNFLSNRLLDLLDAHIVVGDVETGDRYYFTKGGNAVKVQGNLESLKVQGAHDIKLGTNIDVVRLYPQFNGNTYFINKPIQTSMQSVYKVLSTTPEFSEFFGLLSGFPSSSSSVIFMKTTNYYGIDFNIKFFNTFNYTVYVPTNEVLQAAIEQGIIPSWDSRPGILGINDMPAGPAKDEAIKKLERFLRYHFQDRSVFISGKSVDEVYQTATIKNDDVETQFRTYKNKYYKLGITGDGNGLDLSTEIYGAAKVKTDNGLYNIMTRDYVFSANPTSFKEIDDSGTGTPFTSSEIRTSSTAVIHQIDNILRFE